MARTAAPGVAPVVSGRRAPRRLLGGPSPERPPAAPLPGYLCAQCQDAPAVLFMPALWGGEMGVCRACHAARHRPDARPCSSHPGRATGGGLSTTRITTVVRRL